MSTRELFVKKFGEADARALEAAAEGHATPSNSKNRGSDPFRWALCIAIGYECIGRFSVYHGLQAAPTDIQQWIKEEARLDLHDGDIDYLSALTGAYNEYLPEKV